MEYVTHAHRFADIILNSGYAIKQEIEEVIQFISFETILNEFEQENLRRTQAGKRLAQGKQSTINALFRREFNARGWETEKNVFNDRENDLAIDFWKHNIGIDVAFNHRSFIGGDLLRLQARSGSTSAQPRSLPKLCQRRTEVRWSYLRERNGISKTSNQFSQPPYFWSD